MENSKAILERKPSTELTQLGNKIELPTHPDKAILERIVIKNTDVRKAIVRFNCPEFTSLCPVTGQPDYCRFTIDYLPINFLVESKSLKLFLGSFRQHGGFHEDITATIGTRFQKACEPQWIRVVGVWYPRGGISIDVFWEEGDPGNVRIPKVLIPPHMGR
jgi:7-cyano-7-deazaguanine reductase